MKTTLSAPFLTLESVGQYFESVLDWKPDAFVLMPTDFNRTENRGRWDGSVAPNIFHANYNTFPFGRYLLPRLSLYMDEAEIDLQLAISDEAYRQCLKYSIPFYYCLLLPKFPFNDPKVVEREYPEFFTDGELNISHPLFPEIFRKILLEIHTRYPKMQGFEIWIAEGAGATVHYFTRENFENVRDWLPPWLDMLDGVRRAADVELRIFAHQCVHTRQTRRNYLDLIANYPRFEVLEDITWPEENVALPFLGFLGEGRNSFLGLENRKALNFLLDTEYMGQGILPSFFPDWIYQNVQRARESGIHTVNGRTMFWDNYQTLNNWNRLNASFFCATVQNPQLSLPSLIKLVVEREWSMSVDDRFIQIMLRHSSLFKRIQTIHGVGCTDHSGFPRSEFLGPGNTGMKAVHDLFLRHGTPLHGQCPEPELYNAVEWREQLKMISQVPDIYVREKASAVRELAEIRREVESSLADNPCGCAEFIKKSYALWENFAQDMLLFTKLAAALSADGGNVASLQAEFFNRSKTFREKYGETALFNHASRLEVIAKSPLAAQWRSEVVCP